MNNKQSLPLFRSWLVHFMFYGLGRRVLHSGSQIQGGRGPTEEAEGHWTWSLDVWQGWWCPGYRLFLDCSENIFYFHNQLEDDFFHSIWWYRYLLNINNNIIKVLQMRGSIEYWNIKHRIMLHYKVMIELHIKHIYLMRIVFTTNWTKL